MRRYGGRGKCFVYDCVKQSSIKLRYLPVHHNHGPGPFDFCQKHADEMLRAGGWKEVGK